MAKVIGLFDPHQDTLSNGREDWVHRSTTDPAFPAALAGWVRTHRELIDSLGALRRLGDEGCEALETLLEMRTVAKVRGSWQLWEALIEGDGADPELLLLKELSPSQLESARRALWGPRWDAEVHTET